MHQGLGLNNITEKRFRHILSASPAIIYACQADDFKATFVSDNITAKFGYTIEECLENPDFWVENLHPEDRERILEHHNKILTSGHFDQEYRFRKKNGEYLWIHDVVRLVKDENNRPLEIVGSWLDVSDRKKAEKSLSQSEALFRVLFDTNPTPTIITTNDGVIVSINPSFTSITGYSKDDIVGRTSIDIGFWRNQEDRDRIVATIRENGGIDNHVGHFHRKDGTPMVCLASSRPVVIDGVDYFLNTVVDVTEKQKYEEKIQKSENLFRVLFENNPIPSLITSGNGTIEEVNGAFLDSFGFVREEVEGGSAKELFWKNNDDRQVMLDALREDGYIDHYQCEFYDKKRTLRTCLLSSRTVEIQGDYRVLHTLIDITDKLEAELAREKSEKLFKAMFEINPVGAIVTSPEGVVLLANPTFVKASGYLAEEIIGKTVQDLGFWEREEDRIKMIADIQKFGFVDNLEAMFFGKDRKQIICQVSSRVVELDGDVRILNVVHDVTEQKAAEAAMRDLEQAKSDFISTAAHELRTPLIAVIGYCELLENATEMGITEEQKKKFLDVIQSNAEVLNRLVDDLLDIGRIQVGRSLGISCKETALLPLVEKVVASSQLKSRHHEIVLESDSAVPEIIKIDPGRIAQVLNNLLSNAIKFSPSGGIVKVALEYDAGDVVISVTDQGIGMEPEDAEHIFDRFYRADKDSSESHGLGLGLSIVKQVIDDHGGTIGVKSKPMRGTSVVFRLPFSS